MDPVTLTVVATDNAIHSEMVQLRLVFMSPNLAREIYLPLNLVYDPQALVEDSSTITAYIIMEESEEEEEREEEEDKEKQEPSTLSDGQYIYPWQEDFGYNFKGAEVLTEEIVGATQVSENDFDMVEDAQEAKAAVEAV